MINITGGPVGLVVYSNSIMVKVVFKSVSFGKFVKHARMYKYLKEI